MITWHFYDQSTGLFDGRTFSGPAEALEFNTPEGMAAMRSVERWKAQRVDLSTRALQDYVPPKPAASLEVDHRWDESAKAWISVRTRAGVAADVRQTRDARLAECDWMVTRAVDRDEPVPAEWRAYRQALRDLTEQPGFPNEVTWPEPPL